MSTLTKVLIVLLTISSLFLCGIVVTYVANADNYKKLYTDLYNSERAAREKAIDAGNQLNKAQEQAKLREDQLGAEIASRKQQLDALNIELTDVKRERDQYLQQVNSWVNITQEFYTTNDKQGQLLKNTFDELQRVEAELIKERSQHKETTAALGEKMAIISDQEGKLKQLLEEKTELQTKLDQFLRQFGKTTSISTPVTTKKAPVRVAPITRDKGISLNSLVTSVNLTTKLAGISIGKNHGVKEGMKFHVTRGNDFICDILIIDVDAEEAAGIIELMEVTQKQPKKGDKATTNLQGA